MRQSMIILVAGMLLVLASLAAAAVARNIDSPAAFALLKQRQEVYLLDVRTPQEYQQVHLAGAHLIPIDQVMQRLGELPRNRPILVYCAVGSRSAQVFNFLARRGYPEVYNLDGGITAWAQRGYPVQQGPWNPR
ncbi:MAG: rhodanese-like domain-containing protein [Desulfuromonadales bacterium]|nr:rhodanese-like domain-containing protein [Desulfuromonadales bacterium]